MAYWKGKNTISPVKQEEKKKVELIEKKEVIKTGPKPDPSKRVREFGVNVAPPGMTPRPAELDTSTTTPGIRVYPEPE